MRQARRIVSGIVVLLLFLPASATLPTARWNIHLVQRLRDLKRISPDAELDVTLRRLVPFLPAQGTVGFHSLDRDDDGRLYYRTQYALVPRQLIRSSDAEFVIEAGPAGAAAALDRDARFRLVTSLHDGVRLFRRIQ